jgi:hypothetical protein
MSEMRTIRLPADLCAAAEQRYQKRFTGIDELLTAVLQELLREDSAKMDDAEEQIIEERLRELGYI